MSAKRKIWPSEKGKVLVDYELKNLIDKKIIIGNDIYSQIQPASFEPKIGDEVFIKNKIIKPDKEIYRTILETGYVREKVKDCFELQVGKTYYLRLEEKISMEDPSIRLIKASPKSSVGRIFLYTRLISDFSPSFNEIKYNRVVKDKELELWLVVQPLVFNTIIYPGMVLNQLKFFQGLDYMLSDSEILELHKNHRIVKNEKRMEINNGLKISLDLYGKNSEGIVGLKAKESIKPVDMKEKQNKVEPFFEPIIGKKGKIILSPKDKVLLYSSQNLYIPTKTNAQLSDYYDVGINALLHLAGFFDPNFGGENGANAVLEVIPYENRDIELRHGMDFALLQFFRNETPNKVYGDKELNSHYQGQKGPKVSKFFIPTEHADLKRKWKKLAIEIITIPRLYTENLLEKIGENEFIFLKDSERLKLEDNINKKYVINKRYDCEENPDLLQPIPYVLIFNKKGKIFVYQRADSKKDYGDERLFGKISIGVGGHFVKKDKNLEGCIMRQVTQEELEIVELEKLKFFGALYTERKEVDKVHIGLIYAMLVEDAKKKEESLKRSEFIAFNKLKDYPNKESWTKILEPYLTEIYSRLKG